MEEVKTQSKVLFAFVWGVCWGGLMTLAITLSDRYITHHSEPSYRIVIRFMIFTALGICLGSFIRNRREALSRKKPTRTGNVVRSVLFISLMLGLAFILWKLTSH